MGCVSSKQQETDQRNIKLFRRSFYSKRVIESTDNLNGLLPNKHRVAFLTGTTADGGKNSPVYKSFKNHQLYDPKLLKMIFDMAKPTYVWTRHEVDKRVDRYGWTPLMFAAKNGNTEEVRALINAGASLDLRTTGGSTALMNAAFYGHGDILVLLIRAGAGVDLKCNNGFTALKWAYDQNKRECIQILEAAGAKKRHLNIFLTFCLIPTQCSVCNRRYCIDTLYIIH